MLQIRNIYISEDCKQTSPRSTVLKKLNLKEEAPEENGIDLYRRAAARLVSSFSLTQKSCKTTEQGLKQGSERLSSVDREMRSVLKEKAIILSREQMDVCQSPLSSTFITGTFGTGKTELAFQLIRKFCNYVVEKHTSKGIIIASAFAHRGYCNKILKEYDDMITQHLRLPDEHPVHSKENFSPSSNVWIENGISRLVGKKQWLLERFKIDETASLELVINKLMQRIAKVHPNVPILLVLDEVSESGNWRRLEIPEHITLVLILKPIMYNATSLSFVPPLSSMMRYVNLSRQYRCGTILSEFVNVMSHMLNLIGGFTTLMPELQDSQEKGHEIPGATPEWYHMKHNDRGKDIHIFFVQPAH